MSYPSLSRSTPLSPSPLSPTPKQPLNPHPSRQSPKTPDSPQLMSIRTQSYASNFHTQTSQTEAASQSQMKSPTGAFTSTSPTQQTDMNATNPFPTPADSAYAPSLLPDSEPSINHEAPPSKIGDNTQSNATHMMEVDRPPAREEHERNETKASDVINTSITEDKLASDEISLERIQKDMGEAFLLCRKTLHATRPNPSEHLLSKYGLGDLVSNVARIDPDTGEKINKLRKSYEGQIKDFGLAGRNKPVKLDDNKPGMQSMMDWPDEEWHIQKVASKKIEATTEFRSKLRKAMKMEPGTVWNQEEWDKALGHEKPIAVPPPEPKRIPSSSNLQQSINGGGPRPQRPQMGVNRPSRAGKKRSYDDNSFAGYGEGYIDDAGDDMYSSDDGRGPGRKRRKKASLDATAMTAPD